MRIQSARKSASLIIWEKFSR